MYLALLCSANIKKEEKTKNPAAHCNWKFFLARRALKKGYWNHRRCPHQKYRAIFLIILEMWRAHSQQDEITMEKEVNGLLINVHFGRQQKRENAPSSHTAEEEWIIRTMANVHAIVRGKWQCFSISTAKMTRRTGTHCHNFFFCWREKRTIREFFILFFYVNVRTSALWMIILWLWEYELWLNKKWNAVYYTMWIVREKSRCDERKMCAHARSHWLLWHPSTI